VTSDPAIARARELARADGRARYLHTDIDGETGEPIVRLTVVEPVHDHLRLDPDGAVVAVYLPDDPAVED
jgi:hypothetical protein